MTHAGASTNALTHSSAASASATLLYDRTLVGVFPVTHIDRFHELLGDRAGKYLSLVGGARGGVDGAQVVGYCSIVARGVSKRFGRQPKAPRIGQGPIVLTQLCEDLVVVLYVNQDRNIDVVFRS